MVAHRVSLARGICPPRSNQWTFQISQSKLVFTLNGKLRYYWSFKCPNKNAIAIESLRWEFSHNTKNPPNGRKINSLTSMMTTTNQFNRTIEFWIWFRLRRRTRSLRFAFSVCADTSLSLFYLIFVVRQTSQWLAPHGCLSEMFSFDVWFFFFFFFFFGVLINGYRRAHTHTHTHITFECLRSRFLFVHGWWQVEVDRWSYRLANLQYCLSMYFHLTFELCPSGVFICCCFSF